MNNKKADQRLKKPKKKQTLKRSVSIPQSEKFIKSICYESESEKDLELQDRFNISNGRDVFARYDQLLLEVVPKCAEKMQVIEAKREARVKRKANKPEKKLSTQRMSSVVIEETDRRRNVEPKS